MGNRNPLPRCQRLLPYASAPEDVVEWIESAAEAQARAYRTAAAEALAVAMAADAAEAAAEPSRFVFVGTL